MKSYIIILFYFGLTSMLFIAACEEAAISDAKLDRSQEIKIQNRTFDDECEMCDESLSAACCCKVQLQTGDFPTVPIQVCGILSGLATGTTYAGCTLSTGNDECSTFSEYGASKILSQADNTLHFCIPKGDSYAIRNLSTSEIAYLWVGCDHSGTPSGSYGIIVDPGEAWYFQSSAADCDITICPW